MIHLPPAHIHLHIRAFLIILLVTVCAIGCSEDIKNNDSPTPQDLNVCTSNADCAARLDGITQCDIINRICVAPQAPVQECTNDIDCAARLDGKTLCDTALHQCVAPVPATQECTNDTWNCYGNILTQCVSGKWQISQTCQADTRCNAEKGLCEPNQSECKDTEHFFANQCEADDVTHCGTHTNDCTKLSGWKNGNCIDKACFAEECEIGYHLASLFDSENKERTICEEDTHDACGSINTKCGKEKICAQGECTDKCRPGEVSCNGSCIDPMTSRYFCGADVSCSSYIPCSEFEECRGGKCILSSCPNEDESLCIGKDQNVCVNIHGSNLSHCGACGAVCSDTENAKATGCNHGQCTYTCNDNMVNCGSDIDPMCLSKDQLKSDPLHCGKCDTSCKANELCQDGQCIISACTGNECFYHNACINQNDHCGTQCLNCNTANHASAGICQNGSCVITSCIVGYHLTNKGLCEPDTDTCCGTTCRNCGLDSSCIDGSCKKECLTFTESEIGNYAFANWDTNHDGCISRSEAEAVTEIPEKAFYNNTSLKSLSDLAQFPNLRTIGDSAFEGCSGLTSVSLPQAAHIGDYAFAGCTNIASLDLPQATHIGNKAFYMYMDGLSEVFCDGFYGEEFYGGECSDDECYYDFNEEKWFCAGNHSLKSISLPKATHIGDSAFVGCSGLASLDLPQATHIGDSAFAGCYNLTSVTLPQATYIGNKAFRIVRGYDLYDYYVSYKYFNYVNNLESISLPKATHIGDSAFEGCRTLVSLDLPQATHIGDSAFAGCITLASIDLPQATYIGDGAFKGVEYYNYENGAYEPDEMTILTNLTSISLPKATYIGARAFYGCKNLTSVTLPQATYIGAEAFMGGRLYSAYIEPDVIGDGGTPCHTSTNILTNLTSISLPKATTIEARAFYGCENLTSIDLPQATIIGAEAFAAGEYEVSYHKSGHGSYANSGFYSTTIANTSLTSVSLPQATEIGAYAFSGCTGLESIDLPQATKIGDGAFWGGKRVHEGGLNIPWNGYDDVAGRSLVNTSLTSVSLPQVTEIGSYAFSGYEGLTSIDLPQATFIGANAFSSCTSLTSIDLPQATSIGGSAFSSCTSLTSIDLPQATSIGGSAFSGCTGLTSIDLPQATEIGEYAFSGSTNLMSLVLTSSAEITLTNSSLAPYYYNDEFEGVVTFPLDLDKVTLTLHQNKAVGGSSSPLCTSATEWGGKTWKEIKFVQ